MQRMRLKGTSLNSNTLRDDTKPTNPRQKAKRKSRLNKNRIRAPPFKVGRWRLVKITGLFLLIMSMFFLVAFTSYLFTWQEDQSYVTPANGGLAQTCLNPAGVN